MLSAVNDLNLNQAPYSRENLGRGTKNGTALCVFTTMEICTTVPLNCQEAVVVVFLDLQLTMQSVPITTKVVSLNPTRRGNSIQHYVIKLVSDLRKVGGFLRVLRFPPPIKRTAMI